MTELLDYDDVLTRYEPVLGMEVHVELSTATKMFCGCPTAFGAEPNTQICPVCLGLPGSLPVVNEKAVESAIRIGLALNCEIAPWGRFARKNYFYPDQPKNYQISQYDEPIAFNGYLDVPLDDGTTWRVQIERAHMEEDTGKLTHIGGETGRRSCLRDGAAGSVARLGCFRCAHGSRVDALRCECVADADRCRRVRHPYRDQERQLTQERRGSGPL